MASNLSLDHRDCSGGLVAVNRDANQLGTASGKGGNLRNCTFDIGGVGIGHGLHDNRMTATAQIPRQY